jgi:hypothetical protein
VRSLLDRLSRHPKTAGRLEDYVEINPRIDLTNLNPDLPVSFIPMNAVEDDALGGIIKSVKSLSEVQKGYTPFREGDILWAKITPCMENGKSCIATGLENSIGFGSTEFHVFRPRGNEISREYLWEFLNQETLRRVARFAFTGSAGHQRVPDGFLGNLPLPIPSPKKQQMLVSAMADARKMLREKRAKAEILLAGMDEFLLDALSLTPPTKDGRRIFAVRRVMVTARFDPHFHLPEYTQNQRMLEASSSLPLGRLASFSDEVWKPQKHDATTFRYIEISNVNTSTGEARAETVSVKDAPSRARMAVREHDIIVSLTRPHHGAIAQITADLDGCVASTGFAVLRGINENLVFRDYLWCVLRSRMCLSQMLQRASGGNYPAITESELAKVLVPVPDIATQERIAAEARRRREEARRLRTEAEADWQAAKRWFEDQLLGPVQS